MKMAGYQRKKIADKVVEYFANKVGVEIGYYIVPAEKRKLTAFAMRLLTLRDENFSVDYVRALYSRMVKSNNAMVCLCATCICRDILECDILL